MLQVISPEVEVVLSLIIFFFDSDLLPNREDPDPVRKRSSGVDRILFTADQQFQLEALFQKKKFPVRKEKALLAAKLGVPLEKVTVCCELILASIP